MDAIIGASGLVGSLLREIIPAHCYNSSNIGEIAGMRFDTIWVAAPSAVKWKANADPDTDMGSISYLLDLVGTADARRIVHFSTVDVYGGQQLASGPTEDDHPQSDCPYGSHRLFLEKSWEADVVQAIRLPGLFGKGLKKNIIFDLLEGRNYENISLASSYQWYDLGDLSNLISEINSEQHTIINVATEPVQTADIVCKIFPDVVERCTGTSTVKYDMRSRHGYRFSKDQVIERIRRYAESYRSL